MYENLNSNQQSFNQFWDDAKDGVNYLLTVLLSCHSFADKLQTDLSKEINRLLQKEVCQNRFFNDSLRPVPTVWMESLKEAYPGAAQQVEEYLGHISIPSERDKSILALAASGVTFAGGLILGKRARVVSSTMRFLGLTGGCMTVGNYLHKTDVTVIRSTVNGYLEHCRKDILDILASCG